MNFHTPRRVRKAGIWIGRGSKPSFRADYEDARKWSDACGRCSETRTAYRTVTEELRSSVGDPFEECEDGCRDRKIVRQQRRGYRLHGFVRAVVGSVRVENDVRGMPVVAARCFPCGLLRCRALRDVAVRMAVVVAADRLRAGLHDRAPAGERGIGRPDGRQQIDDQQPTGYATLRFHAQEWISRCKNSELSVKSLRFRF